MGLTKFCKRLLHVKQVPVEGKDHFDQQCLQSLKHNPETDEAKCARQKLFQEIVKDEKLFRSFQSELRRREVDRHHVMFTHASVSMTIHSKEVLVRMGELALRRRASLVAIQLSQDEKSQASKYVSMPSSKVKRHHETRRRSMEIFSKIAAQRTPDGQTVPSDLHVANSESELSSMEISDENQHCDEGDNFVAPPIWAPIGKRTATAKTKRNYVLVEKNTMGDSDRGRHWNVHLALVQRKASCTTPNQPPQDETSQASKYISMPSSEVKRQHETRIRSLEIFSKIAAQCSSCGHKTKTERHQRAISKIESGSMELPDEEHHYQESENFVAPDIWAPIGKRDAGMSLSKNTADETSNVVDGNRR
jgi:hypothetical protein